MGEIIVVASGKGGVGKTTVCANVGTALATLGKKVVLIDGDMGLRNLDIALHLENDVVYDIRDVVEGRCDIKKACIVSKDFPNLVFLPASQSHGNRFFDGDKFRELCLCLASEFDYILIDSPAGIDNGFMYAALACTMAIAVVHPYLSSVRDSDRMVDVLTSSGVENIHLVVNEVREDYIRQGIMMNIDDVVDLLGVPLLGIVPYSVEIIKKSLVGGDELAGVAFLNIAKRIIGDSVPILNLNEKKKKRWFEFFKKKSQ